MLKRILRAALPIVLVLLGVGLVTYGVWGHVVTVVLQPEKTEEVGESAEKPQTPPEEEPEMPPPVPPPGDPWMSPPRDPWMGGPARDPWMGPPPEEPAEEETPPTEEETPSDESAQTKPAEPKTSRDLEPVIVYDVTIGGVTRSETGEIVRTYVADAGGKPPALCPT